MQNTTDREAEIERVTKIMGEILGRKERMLTDQEAWDREGGRRGLKELEDELAELLEELDGPGA